MVQQGKTQEPSCNSLFFYQSLCMTLHDSISVLDIRVNRQIKESITSGSHKGSPGIKARCPSWPQEARCPLAGGKELPQAQHCSEHKSWGSSWGWRLLVPCPRLNQVIFGLPSPTWSKGLICKMLECQEMCFCKFFAFDTFIKLLMISFNFLFKFGGFEMYFTIHCARKCTFNRHLFELNTSKPSRAFYYKWLLLLLPFDKN